MKKFEELTDKEIYDLSDEQVKTYQKIELAENGIVFPVKPTEPKLEDELKPDIVIYAIPLINSRVAFTTKEDADRVLEALQQSPSAGLSDEYGIQRFSHGFGKDYNGQNRMLAVEPKEAYSSSEYERNRAIRDNNNRLTSAYKEASKKYDEQMEKVKEQLKGINEKIAVARENIRNKMRLTHIFVNDYMPIAENDIETAMRFLKLAYHISDSDEAYIRENC